MSQQSHDYKLLGIIATFLGIVLIVAGCSGNNTPSSTPADIAAGQQLYAANCASCHGADGAGGIMVGEEPSPDIRFASLNSIYNGDWSLAKRAILDGKDEEGEDLDPEMPRWRGKLSDTQVNNIVAYLQTLK